MHRLRFGVTSPTTARVTFGRWAVYSTRWSHWSHRSALKIWPAFTKESWAVNILQSHSTLARNWIICWLLWWKSRHLHDLLATKYSKWHPLEEQRENFWVPTMLSNQKMKICVYSARLKFRRTFSIWLTSCPSPITRQDWKPGKSGFPRHRSRGKTNLARIPTNSHFQISNTIRISHSRHPKWNVRIPRNCWVLNVLKKSVSNMRPPYFQTTLNYKSSHLLWTWRSKDSNNRNKWGVRIHKKTPSLFSLIEVRVHCQDSRPSNKCSKFMATTSSTFSHLNENPKFRRQKSNQWDSRSYWLSLPRGLSSLQVV